MHLIPSCPNKVDKDSFTFTFQRIKLFVVARCDRKQIIFILLANVKNDHI